MGKTRCLYPGSFDPVTVGHMDIIARAAKLFDEVIVGVLHNPDKQGGCFPVEKRVAMLESACRGLPNVRVIAYEGLLAQYTKDEGIPVVVRGVRTASDLESETVMAHINHDLNPALETVLLPASPGLADVSASMVRQLAQFGADISAYVPAQALPEIAAAFQRR